MPRATEITPERFNLLPENQKINYVRQALNNDRKFETIIGWLKDTTREHDQKLDETIILLLHSKVDKLIEQGIPLPPPFIDNYYSIFAYAREQIAYMQKYAENPGRPATEKEKEELVTHTLSHSSNVNDVINAIIDSHLLPQIEYSNNSFHIFHYLEKLREPTVHRILEVLHHRGDFERIGLEIVLNVLNKKLNDWNSYRQDFITSNPGRQNYNYDGYRFNKGIKNYTIAKLFVENLIHEKKRRNAREIHTAFESARPGNLMHSLPMNIVGNIGEYATGLRPHEYLGGRRKMTKRVRKSLRRKSSSR